MKYGRSYWIANRADNNAVEFMAENGQNSPRPLSDGSKLAMIGDPRNEMLIVYLGGDRSSPGVLPYGQEGRVQAAFGERLGEVLSICHEIVKALECSPETRASGDLIKIAENVTQLTQEKFSWLEPIVAKKLGTYYSYQMR